MGYGILPAHSSFVYMLLCQDAGPVYIKVGISDRPTKRLLELRHGCPVTPRQFCFMEFGTRRAAKIIERMLHRAFDHWSAHGEWFAVPMADKAAFNEAWKDVIYGRRENGRPCEWQKVSVEPLVKHLHRSSLARLGYIRRRGRVYRDAMAAGLPHF